MNADFYFFNSKFVINMLGVTTVQTDKKKLLQFQISNYLNFLLVIYFFSYSAEFNSFTPASGDFCRLLITSANSLDLDQAQQNVGSDPNPNCLTL